MTDEEVADVVTFIQTAWGNRGKSATSKEVGKMRKHIIPMAVLKQ
jgi:hypothetical protein